MPFMKNIYGSTSIIIEKLMCSHNICKDSSTEMSRMEVYVCFTTLTLSQCFYSLAAGRARGASHSVTMWLRVISLSERHPLNAIVSSNSSRSIWSVFLIPASPSTANENTTGRPI